MWKYIKKMFLNSKPELVDIRIPANYSIKIPNDRNEISYIDKNFIKLLLNFSPNFTNLKCEINRWDSYIEYMENVRAFIYCEVMIDNWNHLRSDLIELREFIEKERKRDIDDFLNLIEVDDVNYQTVTDIDIFEKTICFINDNKRDYQKNCNNRSKIYINIGCSVNYYKIFWGEENSMNLITESYG